MIEAAFTLLFTAAGVVAALLALRAGAGSPAVRWLGVGFLAVAAANLGLYVWPAVAGDPVAAARAAGGAVLLALAVAGYVCLLRAARRAAVQRRDGQ